MDTHVISITVDTVPAFGSRMGYDADGTSVRKPIPLKTYRADCSCGWAEKSLSRGAITTYAVRHKNGRDSRVS